MKAQEYIRRGIVRSFRIPWRSVVVRPRESQSTKGYAHSPWFTVEYRVNGRPWTSFDNFSSTRKRAMCGVACFVYSAPLGGF